MKKAWYVGLLLWAMVCAVPFPVAAQISVDFSGAPPEIDYNGTDYLLTVPELGLLGNRYGGQWQLSLTDGSWGLRSVWNVWNRAFVGTAPPDFATGSFSTIDLSTLETTNTIGAIHGDAVALSANGNIYVINRFGQNNIAVYDPNNLSATPRQFSVAADGINTNPQALVLITPAKAYVTLNRTDFILIVNPQTGAELGRIDISAFADADRIPEAGPALLQNGYVYVALQILNENASFAPAGVGIILKINAATDAIEGSVNLSLQNPTTMVYHAGRKQLLVGCPGAFFPASIGNGGIEAVNLAAMATEGVLVQESALGGDLNKFVMANASKGYAVTSDASFNNTVVSFNVNTGAKLADIFGPLSSFIPDIAVHKGRLYVCDRTTTAPGIRIFNALDDSQITTAPINVGQSPAFIVFY